MCDQGRRAGPPCPRCTAWPGDRWWRRASRWCASRRGSPPRRCVRPRTAAARLRAHQVQLTLFNDQAWIIVPSTLKRFHSAWAGSARRHGRSRFLERSRHPTPARADRRTSETADQDSIRSIRALGAHRVERLQQHGPQQHLRRNRRSPDGSTTPPTRAPSLSSVSARMKRMVRPQPPLDAHVAEQRPRPLVRSTQISLPDEKTQSRSISGSEWPFSVLKPVRTSIRTWSAR